MSVVEHLHGPGDREVEHARSIQEGELPLDCDMADTHYSYALDEEQKGSFSTCEWEQADEHHHSCCTARLRKVCHVGR